MTKTLSKIHQRVNQKPEERLPLGAALENTIWTDLQGLYEAAMNGIARSHGVLAETMLDFSRRPGLMELVADRGTLLNNIQGMQRDIQAQIDHLNAIHVCHKDKTGGTTDANEHSYALMLAERYAESQTFYEVTLNPTVAHIVEQFAAAEAAMMQAQEEAAQAAKAAADATNPEVVTDVAVKEA